MQTKNKSTNKPKGASRVLKKSAGIALAKKPVAKKQAAKTSVAKKSALKKTVTSIQTPSEFTMKQVKEIVALIKDAGTFTTFAYKTKEFEIEIAVGAPAMVQVSAPVAPTQANPVAQSPSLKQDTLRTPETALIVPDSQRVITSPMIGTFYRRPSPSSPPFVEVGDTVTPGMDVCIVEVMKLLNTIASEYSGRILQVLVEDGATIEAGQPLMIVELTDGL